MQPDSDPTPTKLTAHLKIKIFFFFFLKWAQNELLHAEESFCRRAAWKNPRPANQAALRRAARWLASAGQKAEVHRAGDSPREVPNSSWVCRTYSAISSFGASYLCISRAADEAALVSKQLLGLTYLPVTRMKVRGRRDRQAGGSSSAVGRDTCGRSRCSVATGSVSSLPTRSASFPPLIISIKNTELLRMWTCSDT